MQHPVGYKMVNGSAQLTSVEALLTNQFAENAMVHTIAAAESRSPRCWSSASRAGTCGGRGTSRSSARPRWLSLIILVPFSIFNLGFGSHLGIVTTSDQPMKIAGAEALWNTQQPASFSLFQIGGFSASDPTPSFSIQVPDLLSYLSTGNVHAKVEGMNEIDAQYRSCTGRGSYYPNVRLEYWSMRIMAYAGSLVALVGVVGAFLYRRRKLESSGWFLRIATWSIALPFIAALFGWVLTETGRQPWIVQGLLKTANANSPSVSATMVWLSLIVFVGLYIILGAIDLDPDAPLRAARPAGAVRAGRRGREPRPGDELLMNLQNFWFGLIAVLWAGYFMLEGFDFGVGMLLPVIGRNEQGARRDARHHRAGVGRQRGVAGGGRRRHLRGLPCLVCSDVLGLLPGAPAGAGAADRSGSSRSSGATEAPAPAGSTRGFGATSLRARAAPLIWGVALWQTSSRASRSTPSGNFAGSFTDLFSAYTVAGGIATVALFALHGSIFLELKTVGELRSRALHTARRLAPPAVAIVAVYLVWTVVVATGNNHKSAFPAALVAALAVAALALGALFAVRSNAGRAFTATAVGVVLVVATIFTSLYPRVMVSSPDFQNSLTIANSAAAHYALTVMTVVALILTPVVLIYQGWTYYIFRRRLTETPVAAPTPAPAPPEA